MNRSVSVRSLAWFALPLAGAAVAVLAIAPPAAPAEPVRYSEERDRGEASAESYSIPARRTPVRGEAAVAVGAESVRLEAQAPAGSPFHTEREYESESEPVAVADVPSFESDTLHLTSVMSGAAGAVCVVNQRVRRVGDPVAEGWAILSINVEERSVVIVGPGGVEHVLAQR